MTCFCSIENDNALQFANYEKQKKHNVWQMWWDVSCIIRLQTIVASLLLTLSCPLIQRDGSWQVPNGSVEYPILQGIAGVLKLTVSGAHNRAVPKELILPQPISELGVTSNHIRTFRGDHWLSRHTDCSTAVVWDTPGRGMQRNFTQIPDPLWGNKCVLFQAANIWNNL